MYEHAVSNRNYPRYFNKLLKEVRILSSLRRWEWKIDCWKFLNMGYQENSRPNSSMTFFGQIECESRLYSYLIVDTQTLQRGDITVGLLGYYAPTETSEDTWVKRFFYRLVVRKYRKSNSSLTYGLQYLLTATLRLRKSKRKKRFRKND